jgi:rhodanese-related sulfurtransferase
MTAERTITPDRVHALLTADAELALLDVREIEPYSEGHLLFAVPVPLGRLELQIAALVPRRDVPVVVCDDGMGEAARAAVRLAELGYSDVAVLADGVSGWRDAGHEVFSGVNVPSKAFGEVVGHECATPSVTVDELRTMLAAREDGGADVVVLDSRPLEEFQRSSIPGASCCPGGELVFRAFAAVPSNDTTVVVNCAGRTRSIIGAQSLINAGLPNDVYALENGIAGWRLAGLEPDHGESSHAAAPDGAGRALAEEAAATVAARFGVRTITSEELRRWRDERHARSLFVLDVRTRDEFEAAHLADAFHAPGGQLVQATDQYVGVRNARLVLVDDDGVRAPMAASWLLQMGMRDVRVLDQNDAHEDLVCGPGAPAVLGLDGADCELVTPDEAAGAIAAGTPVIDLGESQAYRRRHIPGAWYASRSRLEESLSALPGSDSVVLTSEEGAVARLAAADVGAITDRRVTVVGGGNAGWEGSGRSLTGDGARYLVEPTDIWPVPSLFGSPDPAVARDAMRSYLDWETNLVVQLERDGTTGFSCSPIAE